MSQDEGSESGGRGEQGLEDWRRNNVQGEKPFKNLHLSKEKDCCGKRLYIIYRVINCLHVGRVIISICFRSFP